MQIVKQQDAQGNLRYMIFKAHNSSEQDKLNKAIYDSVTAVILVEFMNVIHTTPRSANVLAAILDDLALEDIAGTVAGFDTVVVISPTRESAVKINTLFNEHLAHDELT